MNSSQLDQIEIYGPYRKRRKILGVRARNCLVNFNITTKQQARKAVRNGNLPPYGKSKWVYRNYGKKAHSEVLRWIDSK